MALSLKLNGSTTASIPGSPSNGDAITMDNGVIRLTFTYGDHVSTLWSLDLLEVWNGSAWLINAYGRDRIRLSISGTEKTGTDVLTLVTNDGTNLVLQLGWSGAVAQGGVNWTCNYQFKMSTAHNYIEMTPTFHGDADYTGSAVLLDPGYFSAGKTGDMVKNFFYGSSPVTGAFSRQALLKENRSIENRVYGQPNTSATLTSNAQRGYGLGGAYLRSNNTLFEAYYDPATHQTLIETLVGGTSYVFADGGYQNWWNTVDSKYRTLHDNKLYFAGLGIMATNPVTAKTYTAKVWLNVEVLTSTMDYDIVSKFNAFALNTAGKMTVTASPVTLPQLAAVVEPTLASTYTAQFNATYGYNGWVDAGVWNSFANALGLQAALRLYRYTGVADYLTEATRIKDILLNTYQDTSGGAQKGAFRKIWNGSAFKCQEGGHNAASDHPHISMYTQAECCIAIMEYYKVNPLAAVKTALNYAADYLLNVQHAAGYWLTEYNNVGGVSGTSPNTGSSLAGSATALLGSFLLEWSMLNPSATNVALYTKAGLKALNYWMTFEPNPHGCYEYGESYNTFSSHALRMVIQGFSRAFKLTGNQGYQNRLMYFMEMAIAQTKKIDVVYNTSKSNNKDIHTGGLLCTLDWNGQVGPEALSIMATLSTSGLRNNINLSRHILFYLWAMRHHALWGMRDSATYTNPSPWGYSYISPGTTYAASQGLDNTNMCFQAPSAALFLIPIYYLIESSNESIYATCLEGDTVEAIGDKRTIIVYNPQATTQTANITVKNLSNPNVTVNCNTAGVVGTPSVSGSNLVIPITLTTDQYATITI